jgi:hypothetical protein
MVFSLNGVCFDFLEIPISIYPNFYFLQHGHQHISMSIIGFVSTDRPKNILLDSIVSCALYDGMCLIEFA